MRPLRVLCGNPCLPPGRLRRAQDSNGRGRKDNARKVHEDAKEDHHEIYLMCDDIRTFGQQMTKQKIACSEIQNQGWGELVQLTLPGGGKLGVYQPRHERPKPMKVKITQAERFQKKVREKKHTLKNQKNSRQSAVM